MPEVANNVFIAKHGAKFGNYGKNPVQSYLFDDNLKEMTVGLVDNKFVIKD